jgi:ketosteroid isomerase-like protein
MGERENAEVVLEIFATIERRDVQRLRELLHPGADLLWPPSLPYGGAGRGMAWAET